MNRRLMALLAALSLLLTLTGCATTAQPVDYSAFKASRPKSIVVLPPVNESPDVKATYGMLSQVTLPLAESGYYVLPVALVDETFRQNGLTVAGDIQAVSLDKLRQIFGADAALYITVHDYGSKYQVVQSVTVVNASAKLVDLKTGETLWTGSGRASSAENSNSGGGGLVGMLVSAALTQIINSATDTAFDIAGIASNRMLWARPGGMLYGPRSPKFETD